ncbi:Predicted dehydrogenase [Arthrobacter sp. ok909]|uniref:Gfo/Idh/MocA family protein n=1 Tax=Arthrobacter sp. ok909 TaxID=1761746 RepID=UPI00087F1DE2|nr:Gfo/Idh/MocA family oxidoreductase [Arthrobacter sp. ok909]SDP79745.1 Predicted dehydrogenase [Arthrobacter sp. ok909]
MQKTTLERLRVPRPGDRNEVAKTYYPPELRAAIVGTGGIARIHGQRIRDLGSRVVGVCGRELSKAQALAADLQPAGREAGVRGGDGIASFDDLGRMLDETRPDVLHVCSPHGFHAGHALEAIKRGIHVICEKPLATTVEDAQRLLDASEAAGIHAAVCLTQRSYPMVAELRSRILSGEIGKIQAVRGTFLSWDSNHDNWGWGFDPKIAGTSYATADLGVHWLDLVEHVTGSRISEVDARFSTLRPKRYKDGVEIDVEAEDYVRVFLQLADGTLGSAVFSGVCAGEPNACSIDVDGMDGGFHWQADDPNILQHRRSDASILTMTRDPEQLSADAGRIAFTPAGHAEGFGDAFRNLIRDVYSAIGGSPVTYPTFADGRRLVSLVHAIQESAQTRKAIDID